MNLQHRTIRELLQTMSPNRAKEYIKSFNLPEDEENVLLLLDVRRLSCVAAGMDIGITPDTVKRYRQRAYAHIADELNN